METYENFARVYDELMDNVPYEEWGKFIREKLVEDGISDGLALDLGCGTGKMTMLMGSYGYDMIGVDSSIDMLEIAREKAMDAPQKYLYLLQDMTEFELYGTVRAVVSVCDSVNYITDPDALLQVFKLVNNYLDPQGLFLFDFNTEHKYRDEIGSTVIAEDRDDVSFIWYNEYDQEEHLNDIDLSVFVRRPDDLYQKFQEEHIQRGYTLEEIKSLLKKSGLVFVDAYDGYQNKPADKDSQRIVILAREHGKMVE
ncbi:MAG: methyltransferase domain-containing protein [Lachnospiraceae bacterium]|nr:methyltransferase domain-containing protein [Lachnospiraceae bacterium]